MLAIIVDTRNRKSHVLIRSLLFFANPVMVLIFIIVTCNFGINRLTNTELIQKSST